MIRFGFNSRKTTQAASYLLKRSRGTMSKGFLIKMLYLADRELLLRRGHPLTGDQPVSMKNGPVLTTTYDLTKGGALEHRAYWQEHITNAPCGYTYVSLIKESGTDCLSKSELEVLNQVFEKFHNFSWKQLVDYCHSLPEWEDPGESSFSIDFKKILTALGKDAEEIAEIENQSSESRVLDVLLTNYAAA
jgi:uncharacterized phage-associated protein